MFNSLINFFTSICSFKYSLYFFRLSILSLWVDGLYETDNDISDSIPDTSKLVGTLNAVSENYIRSVWGYTLCSSFLSSLSSSLDSLTSSSCFIFGIFREGWYAAHASLSYSCSFMFLYIIFAHLLKAVYTSGIVPDAFSVFEG